MAMEYNLHNIYLYLSLSLITCVRALISFYVCPFSFAAGSRHSSIMERLRNCILIWSFSRVYGENRNNISASLLIKFKNPYLHVQENE